MNKLIQDPVVRVNFPEAQRYADLGALAQDLKSVMEICTRIKELLENKSEDNVLIESYWTTAVIKYSRCFKNGKRFGIDESILDGLPGDPQGAHNFYMDMRDKHVAHSVNAFEKNGAGLILSPEDSQERKVRGIALLSMRHIVADKQGVHTLGMLSNVILKEVNNNAKHYEEIALQEAKEISIEELYKKPRISLSAPSPDEAKAARTN